jgi:hypothetical protein
MNTRSIFEGIIIGVAIMAAGASAKAFLDVSKLQAENENMKVMLRDIKEDVRDIRNHLLGE